MCNTFIKKSFHLFLLIIFTCLITFQPFYLVQQLNLNELGIYLPGISAIMDGAIPYRDFFHLRGPLDLYVPTWLMSLFGEDVSVLLTYFYFGNVLTLIMVAVIASQVLRRSFFLYLSIPVIIARTFPRVVFTFWGGARYAIGLMAISTAIQYFKTRNKVLMLVSGIFCSIGLLISIEIGVISTFAILSAFIFQACFLKENKMNSCKGLRWFFGGAFLGITPLVLYFVYHSAFVPYVEQTFVVMTKMLATFPQIDSYPHNIFQMFLAAINPGHSNFKHMTPLYLYVFVAGFLFWQNKNKRIDAHSVGIFCLAAYGLALFLTSFRNISASQFEVALQPEKILLFFLLERSFHWIKEYKQSQKVKKKVIIFLLNFFIFGVVCSSVGIAVSKFYKRFYFFKMVIANFSDKTVLKLNPLRDMELKQVKLARVSNVTLPSWQAEDLTTISKFFESNTYPNEVVLMYPELGALSFVINRPHFYQFPKASFSWFKKEWHESYINELRQKHPRYAVLPKNNKPEYFDRTHFLNANNRQYFNEVISFIEQNYRTIVLSPSYKIMERRKNL